MTYLKDRNEDKKRKSGLGLKISLLTLIGISGGAFYYLNTPKQLDSMTFSNIEGSPLGAEVKKEENIPAHSSTNSNSKEEGAVKSINTAQTMKDTKYAKDLDKVLKNVSGLKKTGTTQLGERRGSRHAGFNEGSGGDGIGGQVGRLLASGGGAVPHTVVHLSAKAKPMGKARARSINMASSPMLDHHVGITKPAHNTEEFAKEVENDFKNVSDEALSTFSIDVDKASYAMARSSIQGGRLPVAGSIRTEEFLNYFSYDYQEPTADKPFSVGVELSESPWDSKKQVLKIAIKGKELEMKDKKAGNLVFLLDVSGSMNSSNKLPLLKQSLKMLVDKLSPEDRVSIVVYAGAAGLVLPSTSVSEKSTIIKALENLRAGGSTAGGQGIQLAYDIAQKNFIKGGNNRIILATDGDFNVGTSNTASLVDLIKEKRKTGVFLSVLGFGRGNYKDSRMEKIANKGNGNYFYIDNFYEAKKVLVQEMAGTLYTIAKDVKLQVEFNPAKVKSYRLIGYENRRLKNQDFNNDKKDAGELGAGHTVTAMYEIVPTSSAQSIKNASVDPLKYQSKSLTTSAQNSQELLTLKLRYKEPDGEKSKLISVPFSGESKAVSKSSADMKFALGVAGFAHVLNGSKYQNDFGYKEIIALAKSFEKDEEGYKVEFLSLVNKAKRLANK